MIYTNETKKALKLCFEAHKDQVDKAGIPYVFHPFHLAEQMQDENTTVVALLHDVVEDTDYTVQDLKDMGFSSEIVNAVVVMTHKDEIPYMEYIKAIKSNPIATEVKKADLAHNSDLSRLDIIDDRAVERKEKYKEAINLLCE